MCMGMGAPNSENKMGGLLGARASHERCPVLACVRSKKKLGSVSEEISMHAHCTTLIIKDSYDVLSNRFSSGLASLTKSF